MAVAKGTDVTAESAGAASTISTSLTIASGSDRLLLVWIGLSDHATKVNSVTFGTRALTKLRAATSASALRGELWGLLNPAVSTATLTATLSGATGNSVLCAKQYTGVDQGATLSAIPYSDADASIYGTISTPALSGDYMSDGIFTDHASDHFSPAGSGQAQDTDTANGTGGVIRLRTSRNTSVASGVIPMRWTATISQNVAYLGVLIRAVVAGQTPYFGQKRVSALTHSYASLTEDARRFGHFSTPIWVRIDRLVARLDGLGTGSGSQEARMVVYADNDGVPANLVASSDVVTVTDGQAEGDVTFAIAAPLWVPPGAYWIGLHSGPADQTIRVANATGGVASYGSAADTFDDGPAGNAASPLGSVITNLFYVRAETTPDPGLSVTNVHPIVSQVVKGTIALSVDAVSVIGVASVQFKVDGANFGALSTAPPWTIELDTTTLSEGAHTYQAVVTGKSGEVITTATTSFTVDNDPPTALISQGTLSAKPPKLILEVDWVSDPGAQQYVTLVTQHQPWAWHRASETSGTVAQDATANNRDATYEGAITFQQTGPITGEPADKAVSLAADARITLTGEQGWPGLTLLFAFESKATVPPDDGVEYIIAAIGASNTPLIQLHYLTDTQRLLLGSGGQTEQNVIVPSALNHVAVAVGPMENWRELPGFDSAFERDPAGPVRARAILLYTNGVLRYDNVWRPYSAPADPLETIDTDWKIPSGLEALYTGRVDEIVWLDKTLSGAQIAAIWAARTLAPPPAPTWTDETVNFRGAEWSCGQAGARGGEAQPGTGSIAMEGSSRRYEPEFASSPLFPNVRPMRRVRLRATRNAQTKELFRGFIEDFPQAWPSHRRSIVTLKIVDVLAVLANGNLEGSAPEELAGTRVGRALDAVGWPAADRVIDAGGWKLAAAELSGDPLSTARQATTSDLGKLYADGAGKAVYHDRDHRSQTTAGAAPQAFFGDGAPSTGELPMLSPEPDYDAQRIKNLILGSRPGGSKQLLDGPSTEEFFARAENASTVLADDTALTEHMTRLLLRLKDPEWTIREFTIDPARLDALWDQALQRQIGDRVMLHRRPQAGTIKRFALHIEGFTHKITVEGRSLKWTVTYRTSLARP